MEVAGEDPGWGGSWAILQEPRFAEVMARHLLWRVEHLGPLLALVLRKPGLGPLRAIVGGAESRGDAETWLPALRAARPGSLRLLTNRRIPALDRHRISKDDEYSFLVDLSLSEDDLFASFESRCRRSIRSADRAGITVRQGCVETDFETAWSLIRETAQDGRVFELPSHDFVREAIGLPFGRLYVAEQAGRMVGSTVALAHGHLEAWIAGFAPAARPTPSSLLYFEIMKRARAEGLRYFDFGPQSIAANPSLTLFKRSFSPLLRPFYVYEVRRGWRGAIVAVQDRIG